MMEATSHNQPPFNCLAFIDLILESSASTYEKLIAIAIARHVGIDSQAAFPSRARLMKLASCSMPTFKRAQPVITEFFAPNQRDGRSTEYSPKAMVTADQIEAAISGMRDRTRSLTDTGSSKTGVPKDTGSDRTRSLTDTRPGIPERPHKEPLNEKKEDSDPNGSGSELPETSLRELVWTKCISWLLPRSCLDESRLRVRVGKWVQEFGAGAVIDAVAIAQKEAPVSIMAYVEGVLRRQAAKAGTPKSDQNLAPWEADELRRSRAADEALERLRKKYEENV